MVFISAAFCWYGCSNVADSIDNALTAMEDDYDSYIDEHGKPQPPASVSDTLNQLLDNYVSGLSNPPPSSIVTTTVDPADSQDLIDSAADNTVYNEAELEALIFDAVLAAEKEVSFNIIGGWLNGDLLYDIVFYRIHDVYMIDAFGLCAYRTLTVTSGATESYTLQFEYIEGASQQEVLDMRSMIDTRSKEIARDLKLGGMSDYEKIETINQYLCDNVYYPDEPYIPHDHTPYGTLFSGRAVCEGYARSAKILCDLAGIDCYYVTGYCNNDPVNGGHAWNLVKIDGEWYQLDITWNDSSSTNDYFLVTDDYMTLSRVWERSDYPASASVPYSIN